MSLTALVKRLSVRVFTATVSRPGPDALGGNVELTIRGDGSYELKVHLHDSGFPNYSFRLGIFLFSSGGTVFALYSRARCTGLCRPGAATSTRRRPARKSGAQRAMGRIRRESSRRASRIPEQPGGVGRIDGARKGHVHALGGHARGAGHPSHRRFHRGRPRRRSHPRRAGTCRVDRCARPSTSCSAPPSIPSSSPAPW